MGINWKKLGQKALDTALDIGGDMAKEAERHTAEIEKAAEKMAKERGTRLSDEAYDKLDKNYNAAYAMQDSITDLKYKYHSRYKDDED